MRLGLAGQRAARVPQGRGAVLEPPVHRACAELQLRGDLLLERGRQGVGERKGAAQLRLGLCRYRLGGLLARVEVLFGLLAGRELEAVALRELRLNAQGLAQEVRLMHDIGHLPY